MPNDYFQFQRFTVNHERCAMKVGTDGTLLGAWARGGRRVLDVGTGSGLIALMMAQRFPSARLLAVDIDPEACAQAADNVARSPFAGRVEVRNCAVQTLTSGFMGFDAIVSNPPFFLHSLKSPDARRSAARHADTLSHADLLAAVGRLLSPEGEFSVIIPYDARRDFEDEAVCRGLWLARECAVSTSQRKPPRRSLLSFVRHPVALTERDELLVGGERYCTLLRDFLLPRTSSVPSVPKTD